MSYRDAQRTATRANKNLTLTGEASLESIRLAIERQRGITITITELPALRGRDLSALTLDYGELKEILHAPAPSAWYRQHAILHELSHLILAHENAAKGITLSELSLSFPTQPRKILGRSSFDDDAEDEAEILADLLAARISTAERLGCRHSLPIAQRIPCPRHQPA